MPNGEATVGNLLAGSAVIGGTQIVTEAIGGGVHWLGTKIPKIGDSINTIVGMGIVKSVVHTASGLG